MLPPNSIRLPALAKYEVLEELGHGGMATVYRARDRRLERDVAVKVLHPHLRASTEIGHRFSAEARAVAKLRHPNIVEVYDVSDDVEPERYLVVELVSGGTLRAFLTEQRFVPPEVAAAICIELLHALEHAHEQGVIHRDVKPENVMIECRTSQSTVPPSSGNTRAGKNRGWAVKLMDFGIAKILDTKGVTQTGQVLGSPAHMSPEQIEGSEVDARADVFGIGVLLYECVVGHLPFEGSNPAQVLRRVLEGNYPRAEQEQPTVGKRWSAIIDGALAHDVSARFASAAALGVALSAELSVLGFESSAEILDRFFEDRVQFAEQHQDFLKARLRALGQQARESDDAFAAAAHYNRALAYSPSDAELLKLVMRMRKRSQLRVRLQRFAPRALAVLIAGSLSFVGMRAYVHRSIPLSEMPLGRRAPLDAASAPIEPRVASVPSPALGFMSTSTIPDERLVPANPQRSPAPGKPHPRTLSVVSVRPPEGVLVAIDGEGARPVFAGLAVPMDEKAHELVFSCKGELCLRQTRNLSPGDRDEPIAVALELKPASLVIDGDSSHTFQINEYPNLGRLRAGASLSVPLRRNDEAITITELETGAQKTLILRAGGEYRSAFDKS